MGHVEDAGFLLSKMIGACQNIEHGQIRNPAEIKTSGFVLYFYSFSMDYVLWSQLNREGDADEREGKKLLHGLFLQSRDQCNDGDFFCV